VGEAELEFVLAGDLGLDGEVALELEAAGVVELALQV
jgi:hypothetical protein